MSHDTRPASLRSFLLGTASDEESEAFSHLILSDDDALLEAQADEDELFDEYARGEMSEADARRFAAVSLRHADGRRRLTFARDLARKADEDEASSTATHRRQPVGDRPRGDDPEPEDLGGAHRLWGALWTPAARPVWIAACLLLLAVDLWQARQLAKPDTATPPAQIADQGPAPDRTASATTPGPDLGGEVEHLQTERRRLEQRLADAERRLVDLARQAEQAAAARAAEAARETAQILLTPPTRGSAIAKFKVPQETKRVQVDVDLSAAPRMQRVRASLLDDDGFQVWGQRDVPTTEDADLPSVSLSVPAEILRPGGYTLRVAPEPAQADRRDGREDQEVAQFDFRIE